MPRRKSKQAVNTMSPVEPTTDELVRIVTDLEEATNSLPEDERREYEDAQRSVVDARYRAETHEGHVKIL